VEIKKLTERLSVSPQVLADNMDAFMPQGFHAINCNRLDVEGSYQPCFTEIEQAMQKHGLEAVYIPVAADNIIADMAGNTVKNQYDGVLSPAFRIRSLIAQTQVGQRGSSENECCCQ
jgi:uncharacterized protein (TIGR01244 family)